MFPLTNSFWGGMPLAALEAGWLNTVANILNDLDGIGCHIEKPAGEGYGWKIVVDAVPEEDFRFKVQPMPDSFARVLFGIWTRNGIECPMDCDSGKAYATVSHGSDDYVWLQLEVDAETDPELNPGKCTAHAGGANPEVLETAGIYRVLGKFTSGAWVQWYRGGDIDDFGTVFDGETKTTAAARSTLERNEEAGDHLHEAQLYDVDTVTADAYSIPYFNADAGTPISGVLDWAAIDSHNTKTTPTQASLEVKADVFQIYGFDGALDQQALVANLTSTPARKASYAYPATFGLDPKLTGAGTGPDGATWDSEFLVRDGFNVYLSGTTLYLDHFVRRMEVKDGRVNFETSPVGTYQVTADLGALHGSDGTDHDHSSGDITDWDEIFQHSNLTDMPSATNTDHDGRYWANLASLGAPDTKDYSTSGAVKGGTLGLVAGESSPGTNLWSESEFSAVVTGIMSLNIGGNLDIQAEAITVDGFVGASFEFNAVDAYGNHTVIRVHKGIIYE